MGEEQKEKLLQHQNISEEEESLKQRAWIESKKMWRVAGPAIFTRFSTFGIIVVSQSFIGHIGSSELAAYALVQTVMVRFANGLLLGMASALETLCGQAYGAKQYDMLGVYLQRSWIVLFLTIILLLPVYIFTTPILVALGQEKNTAQVAGSIAFWSIGIIFAFAVSFTCQMFLQAQSKNKIIAYLATVSISIHVFMSWLLTVKYKFGLNGAMASIIVAHWIRNVGQLVFIMNKCPETWKGFSFAAFKDLWPVIKLSLSSGAMLCVRVSNELGRGSSKAAKFFIVITVLTSFSIDFNLCSLQRRRMEKKLPKLKCLSILQNEKYKDRVCLIPILWQNLV